MNNIHYFVKTMLVSLVLLTTFTSLHAAEYNAASCNNCSDMQMQARAAAAMPNGGNVHVIDFEENRIKAFDVHSEWGLVNVIEKTANPEIQEVVDELKENIQFLENLATGSIPLSSIQPYMQSSTVISSAHTVAYYGPKKTAVANALAKYLEGSVIATIKSALDALGKTAVSAAFTVSLNYKVTFPDGTTYRFVFKELDVDALTGEVTISIEPNKNSGRDGDAVLPERSNGGYAGFDTAGSTTSMARLLEYAKSRGVIINYQGGASKTTTTIIDCTEGPNGEMTCHAKK